jgi:hypothetical protein
MPPGFIAFGQNCWIGSKLVLAPAVLALSRRSSCVPALLFRSGEGRVADLELPGNTGHFIC